jgi:hypothetical protein
MPVLHNPWERQFAGSAQTQTFLELRDWTRCIYSGVAFNDGESQPLFALQRSIRLPAQSRTNWLEIAQLHATGQSVFATMFKFLSEMVFKARNSTS